SSKDWVMLSPIFFSMLIRSVQISISCRPLCEPFMVPLPELERIFTRSSSDSSPRPASSWMRRNASFSPGTKKPLTRSNRWLKLCPIPLEADRESPSVQNPIEKSAVPLRGRGSDGKSVKVYTSHVSPSISEDSCRKPRLTLTKLTLQRCRRTMSPGKNADSQRVLLSLTH